MSRVLVIGCGGVANVAIRKCCMVPEVFSELCIAQTPWRSCAPSSTATSPIWL